MYTYFRTSQLQTVKVSDTTMYKKVEMFVTEKLLHRNERCWSKDTTTAKVQRPLTFIKWFAFKEIASFLAMTNPPRFRQKAATESSISL